MNEELPPTLVLNHTYYTVPTILSWLVSAMYLWAIPFLYLKNEWLDLFLSVILMLTFIVMGIGFRKSVLSSDNINKSILPAFKINDNEMFIGTHQELELYLELNNIPDDNVNFEQVYKIHKFD